MHGRRWVLVTAALLCGGCSYLKVPFALRQLNGTRPGSVARAPDEERVARAVRDQVADAYFHPDVVAGWLKVGLGGGQTAFTELTGCLEGASDPTGDDVDACIRRFATEGVAAWGLPTTIPADTTWQRDNHALELEADAQRLVGNLVGLATTLLTMKRGIGRDDFDLASGLAEGARRASQYITARGWRRASDRHNPALVMSGGSANGAYSAGIVFRLLEVYEVCRGAPAPAGCPEAKLDLVVGTSTGTLIGAIVDLFFTPPSPSTPQPMAVAKGELMTRYTCSVEEDLYCVHDEWAWKLFKDRKGMMRFDGIEQLLAARLDEPTFTNGTELVAVSVQLEDGDVYGESDLDPADQGTKEQRIDALMASIVLPVFSDPVSLTERDGAARGTFVDGGVRSVVPVLEAVGRGADRVLALSNTPFDPVPAEAPRHAFDIMLRGMDLLASSGITEPQMAQMRALTRRWAEYRACQARTESWLTGPATGDGDEASPPSSWTEDVRERFCRRRGMPADDGEEKSGRSNWSVAPTFPEVATSYDASWFFLPEQGDATAVGYSFDPAVMRPLFLTGVKAFQARCPEVLRLLGIDGTLAAAQCDPSPADEAARVARSFADLDTCRENVGELRECTCE